MEQQFKLTKFKDPNLKFTAERYSDEKCYTLKGRKRAFDWFSDLDFFIPDDIKVSIVDGDSPAHDIQYVKVGNFKALCDLQTFLLQKNYKVNFVEKVIPAIGFF